jgi:uncharacterized membrane protein
MNAPTPPAGRPGKKRRSSFLTSTVVSGFVVLLPAMVMGWLFYFVYGFIRPLVQPVANLITSRFQLNDIAAFLLVMAVMLMVMFVVGLAVRTALGRLLGNLLETRFLSIAPGYNIIKEVVKQFSGDRPNPFSNACLVQIFDSHTMVTAFVIDSHENGLSTIFVPTGPNPTSGFVLHVPTRYVHIIPTPVPEVMKSIIACGIGSAPLIADFNKVQAARASAGAAGAAHSNHVPVQVS